MPSIDNKVYGLQTSVFNDLKKAGPLTQEKVLAAVSKDGVIDQAEQDLLNEIESGNTDLELSDKSEAQISQLGAEGTTFDPVSSGTSVKLNFSQVGAKVKERSLSEEASIRASGLNMRTRSEARRQLGGDIESVTRLLEADQTMTGNPTQNRVNLESARKMLVQDLNLLQKMGLLSTDEKAKLDQIIDFMKKNITKSVPPSTLKAQVEQLSAMIKPHLESLKGASPSDVLTVDQGSLAVINSDAGGDIDTQMQTVDTNFDALLAAGDAAADDVRVSGLETGLSQDNMQGAKVNAGRDFGRMMGAIDEADKQHAILTDNVIPTVEKFIQETEKKIDARIMELYEKPTLEEAKAAMAADPSKAKGDEQLQGLILKRNDAIVKYQQLADKVKVLAQARVDGLKQFKEVKTIHSDMVARVNDIGLTGSDLSVAYGQLASLKAKVTDAQTRIAELSAKASELETSNAPDKAQQLESLNAQIDGIKKSLTGNQKDVEAIRAKMQTGLQQLHDKLKAGGANPTELKLVTQQIDSLSRLQLSGGKSIEDMAADLSILENNREHTLKDLKQLVPSRLDIREFKALTQLDQNVTKTSRSVLDIQREIRTGNFSADAAKASIDLAITSAKSDVGAADNMIGKAKQFEDPKKGGYVGIAYGSHFGVELWAGLGVGGDIGIAEAKISASLNAALKVSKDFEHGERPYRLQVDLGIKVEGDLSIAKIFDAHAEVKAGLSAGLAFKDLGEVGDFAKRMGKVMALANAIGHIGGMSDVSEIQAQLDKEIEELGKVIKEKGYTGNYLEIGASAKSQLPGADLGLKGNWRRQENTFNDGQTVQTDNYMGKLNVGEFGVKVTHNRSQVTAENGQPVTGKPVSTRTAVHITLPTEMISHAMKHGGFKNLPKGLMEEVVKQFKALNPMMAEFSTGMVLSCLDTAISKSSADGTLAKILDLAKQNRAHHPGAHGHSHGENEIAIGIEYIEHWHNDQHGEGYFAVEFGVEGDKEYKKDIPLGSVGHVRLGAKASYDLGVYVKIPGTKHELHPPSTTGGHH